MKKEYTLMLSIFYVHSASLQLEQKSLELLITINFPTYSHFDDEQH